MSESAGAVVDEPVVTTAKPVPETSRKHQPLYSVIVEDDDLHTYHYVILALSKVCGHSLEKSFELAKEIDTTGRAAVWMGAMEVAELKRDQIREFGPDIFASEPVTFPLGVYIEPVT